MSTSDSVTCHRDTTTCFLSYASQNRNQGFFNDVIIRANDNQQISANRMVLSCYSEYFETMFKSQMKEQYQSSVDIQGFDGKSLELLIDFIYSGQITINSDNVINLLSCADYLQLNDVKEFCFKFIVVNLTPEKCFPSIHLADIYRSESLKIKVFEFVRKNYNLVASTDDFKKQSKTDLIQFISLCNEYPVRPSAICKSIMEWAKHDQETRTDELADLFKFVNFKQLPSGYLQDVVYDDIIQRNKTCFKVITDQIMGLLQNTEFFNAENSVLSLGGRQSETKVLKIYSYFPQRSTSVVYPDLPKPVRKHCTLKLDQFIYCMGGLLSNKSYFKDVLRMNLNENPLKWSVVASMINCRTNFGAAVFNNALVVAGGRNRQSAALASAETYRIATNRWKAVSSLKCGREENQLIVCDRSLFVIGGIDGNKCLSSVERLNYIDDDWYNVAPMHEERKQFAAVSFGGFIYAVGGVNNKKEDLKCVEKYDPRLDTWTYVNGLHIARYDHCACVLRDEIIVVGGYNTTDKEATNSLEIYSPTFDKWYLEKNIIKYLDEHSLVVV